MDAPLMPESQPSPTDEPVPYGSQLTVRALAEPDGAAVTVVAKDGTATTLTWSGLERAANQWARALRSSSVHHGGMVALSIPNSVELVVAALATWKVGAVPIPMRWDLPEWEHRRLLDVIKPALEISEKNLAALADAARGEDDTALPEIVSPAVNGICSSGSTGLP
jgi:bile acid-coenzyme A ligase